MGVNFQTKSEVWSMRKIAITILLCLFFMGISACPSLANNSTTLTTPPKAASSMDATTFWGQTLPVLDALAPTLSIFNMSTEVVEGKTISIYNVSFESLNFVNHPGNLIMRGYLVRPDNSSGNLGAVPGMVLMHGLTGDTNQTLPGAKHFAAHDYIVLCYDQPGHGRSDGPKPNSTNFFSPDFVDQYNETAHFYLSNCAALEAVRVLGNQTGVNMSEIIVGGGSYGGLNAMVAAGVSQLSSFPLKVAAVIDGIGAGDIPASMRVQGKLARYLMGGDTPEFEVTYAQIQGFWDPISYVSQPNFPPMLVICGTNDEFFDITSFNNTYSASLSPQSAIKITANGHHAVDLNDITILDWLNATLFGGPAVPSVNLGEINLVNSLVNTGASVKFTVASAAGMVARVDIVYAYVDLLGYVWHTAQVTAGSDGTYLASIPAPYLDSNTQFFVKVTLTNGAVFTSPVRAIQLSNKLSWLLWVCFFALIATLAGLVIWRRLKGLDRAEEILGRENMDPLIRRKTYIDLFLITANGINILLSFYLPLADFGGTNAWNASYIINNYFPVFLPFSSEWLGPTLVVLMAIGFAISLWIPLLTGLADLVLPITILAILGMLMSLISTFVPFGVVYGGAALYTTILGAAIAIAVGIFRVRYWRPIKRAMKAMLKSEKEGANRCSNISVN